MKITVNEESEIILKEVYVGLGLESDAGEKFSICMRDSGFEFMYNNKKYEAKKGKLTAHASGKASDFEMELYELINRHAGAGLKKPDLVHKMEYVTESCRIS